MARTKMNRTEAKRFDALAALTLPRFRSVIGKMTLAELAALEQRIALLQVKQRFALASHGIERHRAPNELGLLERRRAAVRRLIERGPAPVQLHLVEMAGAPIELLVPEWEEQAA
jgi:hypothetical protein